MNVPVALVAIAVTVVLMALYVAAEFATVGARRSRLKEMADAGDARAVTLLDIVSDHDGLDRYVAACQIGITVASLVAGAFGQAALTPVLEPHLGAVGGKGAAVAIILIGITVLQVVLGELLPKAVALRHPERLALAVLPPMLFSRWLFRPLIALFNGSAVRILGVFGLRAEGGHAHVHSADELAGLYRESAAGGLIDAAEPEMLAGILEVADRRVDEIMTPRPRFVSVDASTSVGDALAELASGPYSRFPITEGDDEIGVVDLRDLYVCARTDPKAEVRTITRTVVEVTDATTVPALWRTLRDRREHVAFVVNEYGDVAGMVTFEDAIEEIFGEVVDEFDEEEEPIRVVGDRIVVEGDVQLNRLVSRFGLRLEDEGVDTIGGLIWHRLGRTPAVGDVVALTPDGPELRVDQMERRSVLRASFPVEAVEEP
jgi:CBS domain containing-hemolysin-like protein